MESTKGNMVGIFYDDLNALVENMWDFPEIRDELSPEECALREKLFMIASLDKSLQALLQTDLLNDLQSTCGDLLAVLAAHTKSSKSYSRNVLMGLSGLND